MNAPCPATAGMRRMHACRRELRAACNGLYGPQKGGNEDDGAPHRRVCDTALNVAAHLVTIRGRNWPHFMIPNKICSERGEPGSVPHS